MTVNSVWPCHAALFFSLKSAATKKSLRCRHLHGPFISFADFILSRMHPQDMVDSPPLTLPHPGKLSRLPRCRNSDEPDNRQVNARSWLSLSLVVYLSAACFFLLVLIILEQPLAACKSHPLIIWQRLGPSCQL